MAAEISASTVRMYGKTWMIAIMRPIAESRLYARHMEVEKGLQDSEARSRAILGVVADGILAIDEQGVIESLNPAAQHMFRYTETEAAGRSVRDLMPEHDGPLEVDRLPGAITGKYPGTVVFRRELECRREDAFTFPIDLAVTKVELAGGSHFISIVRDLTERQETHENVQRLAAIVNSLDDAIISCDIQGTIDSWNNGAEALYGYSAREAIGSPLGIVTPRKTQSTFDERIKTAIAGVSSEIFETQKLTKEGRPVDVSINVSRISDAEGDVIGLAVVHRDISSQKRAQTAQRNLTEPCSCRGTQPFVS